MMTVTIAMPTTTMTSITMTTTTMTTTMTIIMMTSQVAIVYAQTDRVAYVRQLLAAGSGVNHRDGANYNSMLNLLWQSKRNGKGLTDDEVVIAALLIDSGYDLNDRPERNCWYKFGGTAIKMAAEQGAQRLVEMFLDRGADPDIPGSSLLLLLRCEIYIYDDLGLLFQDRIF